MFGSAEPLCGYHHKWIFFFMNHSAIGYWWSLALWNGVVELLENSLRLEWATMYCISMRIAHEPLVRYAYAKLWAAHTLGVMPGTFSPPAPPLGWRSRHASCAVMHAGIANYQFPLKSVAGKRKRSRHSFPAHEQPAILHIWYEAHSVS